MDPYIGQINLFPWKWAPRGWAKCDGSLLSINDHQALFSLLGTTYGGDGRTNFGLPDMRGKKTVNGERVNYYVSLQGVYPSRN
ncbi:MAG: tail fiber protein [Acidimicrobiia bacterium]|nr:tail fiber protein [Acidimicrobiia bacterium]